MEESALEQYDGKDVELELELEESGGLGGSSGAIVLLW